MVGFVNDPDPALPETSHSESLQGKKHKPCALNTETKSEAVCQAKWSGSDRTADSEKAAIAVKGSDGAPSEVPKTQRKVISLAALRPGVVERGTTSCAYVRCACVCACVTSIVNERL